MRDVGGEIAPSSRATLAVFPDARFAANSGNSGINGRCQRKMLAGLINQFRPTLNPLFDKVLAIPGVAELIKPIIDGVRTTLTALSAT